MPLTIVKKLTYIFFVSLLAIACVEKYDLSFKSNTNLVVVDDPVITDVLKIQQVKLLRTIPSSRNSINTPLTGAKVEIIIDGSKSINFPEVLANEGFYQSEIAFKAEPNKTYELKITLPDGSVFVSNKETLLPVSPIKKVSQKFSTGGIKTNNTYFANHNIYVDLLDPANEKNFYKWQWKLYEQQQVCRSCGPGESYYPDSKSPDSMGVCIADLPNSLRTVIYDYSCNNRCWEILYSKKVTIFKDEFYNGQEVKGIEVAQIPYYSNSVGLIVLSQQSISKGAYTYYNLLNNQNYNSGSLADTPPATLIGNLSQQSGASTPIIGYFSVSSEKEFRYVINRNDIPSNGQHFPLGLLPVGRKINFEPATPTRPPLAPCQNSLFRTNIKPLGWPN
jgi:hypothetical protein